MSNYAQKIIYAFAFCVLIKDLLFVRTYNTNVTNVIVGDSNFLNYFYHFYLCVNVVYAVGYADDVALQVKGIQPEDMH